MTDLLLRRMFPYPSENGILGVLYWDSVFAAYTVENMERMIPYGRYEVTIDYSNRFGRDMPHILDVPGRDGIRIHVANFPDELSGCIGIGLERGDECSVIHSRLAMKEFQPKLAYELSQGKVFIDIPREI